jgi:hypothetical protein
MFLDEIPVHAFIDGVRSLGDKAPKDPGEWAFGGLKRGEDGSFKDEDLVRLMQEATDNVAGKSYFPDCNLTLD